MPLAIQAKNYRGLVEVDWAIPPGLSVVVGANGAGKTTLLVLLDLLRQTACRDRGLAAAVDLLGGARALKHLGSVADAAVVLGARWEELAWQIEPLPMGDGLAAYPAERLSAGGKTWFSHASGSPTVRWEGPLPDSIAKAPVLNADPLSGSTQPLAAAIAMMNFSLDAMSALRRISLVLPWDPFPARPLLDALEGCHIFYEPLLGQLRRGSEASPHKSLQWNGANAFSVLLNWKLWSPDRHRYEFVAESLRECFGFFGDLDFQQGGRVVEGWIVHRKHPGSFPASFAAEGWLAALLHFTAVAGADRGQIVGIDSFENALHPRALATAIDLIRDYADANGISVVLTTQSPQVLDAFGAHPEKVFVLDPRYLPGPRALTELRTEEWLAHFRLGRKYADGDFGAEPLE